METLKLRLEMNGRPVKKKDYFTLSSLYYNRHKLSTHVFLKVALAGGRIWDLFLFSFIFTLKCSALDHSATVPPVSCQLTFTI